MPWFCTLHLALAFDSSSNVEGGSWSVDTAFQEAHAELRKMPATGGCVAPAKAPERACAPSQSPVACGVACAALCPSVS
eukprot:4009244-Prymnesium_polylepis.1